MDADTFNIFSFRFEVIPPTAFLVQDSPIVAILEQEQSTIGERPMRILTVQLNPIEEMLSNLFYGSGISTEERDEWLEDLQSEPGYEAFVAAVEEGYTTYQYWVGVNDLFLHRVVITSESYQNYVSTGFFSAAGYDLQTTRSYQVDLYNHRTRIEIELPREAGAEL